MGYQSENAMVTQMGDQVIAELRAEMSERGHTSEPPRRESPPPVVPLALATGTLATDPNVISMFAIMQANMDAMRLQMEAANKQPYVDYSSRGRGHGCEYGGRGHSFSRGFGRGRGRGVKRPLQCSRGGRYCHTHGNCAHNGADYQTPSATHKPNASFADMMGGSTKACK